MLSRYFCGGWTLFILTVLKLFGESQVFTTNPLQASVKASIYTVEDGKVQLVEVIEVNKHKY
jgi:hypothetical protein